MLRNNLGLPALRKNMDDKKRTKEIKNKVFDETRKETPRFFNVDYAERMPVCFTCKWKKINKCQLFAPGKLKFNRADNYTRCHSQCELVFCRIMITALMCDTHFLFLFGVPSFFCASGTEGMQS